MTTWAMPMGEGTTPAATRPPMCEISARKYAPTSSAIWRNFFQSGTQEYEEKPAMIILGLFSSASLRMLS